MCVNSTRTRSSPTARIVGRSPINEHHRLHCCCVPVTVAIQAFALLVAAVGFSYRLAKENMEEAVKLREAYVNKKSKERQFAVGDRCLVHFPNVKPGQNQKFTSRWKGVYTVVAVVGPVNVKLRLTPTSKPILVHVNRVKHLTERERQTWQDSRPDSYEPHAPAEPTPPGSPERQPRQKPRKATKKQATRKDPAKPKNRRARKHLVVYVDSSSSMPDSSEEDDGADQVAAPASPQPGPAPNQQHQTPTRYVAGGDEQSSSEDELFFTPRRADRADSSPDFHGFADPAEFQRESTAAEKSAFNQVTGRVTRHRAAKEDINVPTHQRCAQTGQSSKKK